MCMVQEKSAEGTVGYTESHTAAAVWLFLPIWEGEELFKAGDFFRFPFPSFQGERL